MCTKSHLAISSYDGFKFFISNLDQNYILMELYSFAIYLHGKQILSHNSPYFYLFGIYFKLYSFGHWTFLTFFLVDIAQWAKLA